MRQLFNPYLTETFELVQFEGTYRDQLNYFNVKKKRFLFLNTYKTLWEQDKCWLPEFSSFPTMFSKGFFLREATGRQCVVKG